MTEKHSPKRNENVDKNNNRRVKQTQGFKNSTLNPNFFINQ